MEGWVMEAKVVIHVSRMEPQAERLQDAAIWQLYRHLKGASEALEVIMRGKMLTKR